MTQGHGRGGLALVDHRLPALDGLRGVAILLVMLYHFSLYGGMRPQSLLDELYLKVTSLGWMGVDLFFVLSGFLITGILHETRGGPHFFRNFYARRTLRIFPVYYATLLVAFVVIPALVEVSAAYGQMVDQQLWYWSYLTNFELARGYWPEYGGLGHFWSLAVEEQFYLVWPLLVFAVPARRLPLVCMGIMVGALLLRAWLVHAGSALGAFVLMPARSDALALGGLLALLMRQPGAIDRLSHASRPMLMIASAALLCVLVWRRGMNTEDPVVQTVGFSAVTLFFGAILLIALISPAASAVGGVLRSRALMTLGRFSYALYIFHHPVAIYLGSRWIAVDSMPRILGSELPGQAVFIALAGGVSFGLAWISWHVIESPFLRLKDRFPYAATS